MIVTSMRCYLNILTQLMTKEELLNAQYYIADRTASTGGYTSHHYWNPDTEQYEDTENDDAEKPSIYLVGYASSACNCNMASMLSGFKQLDIDKIARSSDPRDRIHAYIHREQFVLSLYNEFIRNIRTDKLMIVVFTDEDTVRYGVNLFCEMVSQDFGQDITFIDPMYRPYVQGRSTYVGDKLRGEQLIKQLQDKTQITAFMAAMSHNNYESGTNNLQAFFKNFKEPMELIHLHDILWPDDKLQPGMYTCADIKEIIIGKAFDEEDYRIQRVPNMQIIDSNYSAMMTNR